MSQHNSVHEPLSESWLELQHISKGYSLNKNAIDILKDINLTVNAGERIAVVGPSGIGKSTLLHIIGTIDRPDTGCLLFEGKNIFSFDDLQLARFRNEAIGFVFQFHHLLPEFTALENVMMPAFIRGISQKNIYPKAEHILVRVGLQDRLHHRIGELSGGEQQRVALARALVLSPALLLADEPTGNLDKKNSEKIHQLFIELNQETHMTLIVVTHNQGLAGCMSRRITIVDGQLQECNHNEMV
ncbi:MAG: ABC transporter ATP-binding protein [Desulfobacterales bacterium]|nr:ABC transporter ATP-binding protein [Desulfobacterales bacterium]